MYPKINNLCDFDKIKVSGLDAILKFFLYKHM